MNEEEKINVEILNNIKEYMQNSIDRGYHKFIYNDLGFDEKCVDIINAIDYFIERVEQQQKEIDILKLTNNYLDIANKDYISKDKIKDKIKELSKTQAYKVGLEEYTIKILQELLEE